MQPTDFVGLLIEMRSGQVAQDINAKFNEILEAVQRTAGKGKLTVEFTIQPGKLGMGGVVIEVDIEHETKLKRPELKVGKAVFFVTKDGVLTRNDPDQQDMELFEEETKSDVRNHER